MASRGGGKNTIHRTRLTLGERLRREFQREAERRTVGPGDLLHAEGGADTYGSVPTYLQPGQAPQLSRLQAADPEAVLSAEPIPRLVGLTHQLVQILGQVSRESLKTPSKLRCPRVQLT